MREVNEELKENYWRVLRRTRKSGRIASSVIERVEKSWEAFDPYVVEEALRIHVARYPDRGENYTLGIMRNLQRQKKEGKPVNPAPNNKFVNFKQRDYDFKELERQLINK